VRRPRVWNYQVLAQRRFRGRLLGWLALLAFVFLVSVSIRLLYLRSPRRVTIGSGETEGAVHQFLLSLAKDSARSELDIQPEMATGTIDLLDQVHSGELDFAIVHGGFDMDHYHNIRQIGVLSVAPVHLLVKKEHHAAVLGDLQKLRGRTISLGSGKHTVIYLLSQEVLSFIGLTPHDYRPLVIPYEELVRENDPSRLPDVVFISTMPPSDVVRRLVADFGYRLVPLPFGDAFRLTALHHGALSPVVEGIRKENIVDATIPAYAYKASPPVPPQATLTLGLRVLLVANSQTDRTTVTKVLDLMIASRFAEAMQPSLDAGMVRQHAEVPWHPGALDYRRRDDPMITGERIGVLSNALQIVLPAGGTVLLLWGWLRNRMQLRRELGFDRFIALISGVERRALELEQSGNHDPLAIRRLHRELCTIKDAALERIAIGEARDASLVSSLFSHIGDVRAFLAHLERTWSMAPPPEE
jgi:TRAP-type uncharacterized transport system substrate-binding protein